MLIETACRVSWRTQATYNLSNILKRDKVQPEQGFSAQDLVGGKALGIS